MKGMKRIFLENELHRRLVDWSYYVLDESGYPAKSTIADFGLVGSFVRQSRPPFPLNRLEGDEMNAWINIMGACHPEYKQVIAAFYLRKEDVTIAQLAKSFKISESTFKQRLREARNWLSGCISV